MHSLSAWLMKVAFFSAGEKHGSADTQFGLRWIYDGWGWLGGWRGWRQLRTNLFTCKAAGASPRPTLDRRFSKVSLLRTSLCFSSQVSLGSCLKVYVTASKDAGQGCSTPLPGVWGRMPHKEQPQEEDLTKASGGRLPRKEQPPKGGKTHKKGDRENPVSGKVMMRDQARWSIIISRARTMSKRGMAGASFPTT